ncbi:hypothetical protein QTP88_019881 [Uroleucon formosanum]
MRTLSTLHDCIIINNYYQNNKSIAARTRFDCSKTSQFAFAPRSNLDRQPRSRRGNQRYLFYIGSAAARSGRAILDRGSRSRSRKGNRTLIRRVFIRGGKRRSAYVLADERRKIRTAKEQHFANECKEIENYMRVSDSFNLHKKIKEAARINKFKIWQQYLEKELFHDIWSEEHKITFDGSGPSIMVTEVQNAINKS